MLRATSLRTSGAGSSDEGVGGGDFSGAGDEMWAWEVCEWWRGGFGDGGEEGNVGSDWGGVFGWGSGGGDECDGGIRG